MKSTERSSAILAAALELRVQRTSSARVRIEAARPGQRAAFEALTGQFAPRLAQVAGTARNPYQTDYWRRKSRSFERGLLPSPSFAFLQSAAFQVMQPDVPAAPLLANLRRSAWARRPEILLEDAVGEAPGLVPSCLSSMTQLHHLNDLLWFRGSTGCRLETIGTIVEWGGGYGCLAKLLRRLRPGGTHVIIDIPLMSCVQWLYLTAIFGPEGVHQIRTEEDVVLPGRINLLPLTFLERRGDLRADLFISAFALNESSDLAQDFVLSRNWFGARHLLVACDDRVSDARKVTAAAARRGARLKTGAHPRETYALL